MILIHYRVPLVINAHDILWEQACYGWHSIETAGEENQFLPEVLDGFRS